VIARLQLLAALVVVAVAATAGSASASATAGKPRVRPVQQLAVLLYAHKVASAPRARPSWIRTVRAWRPITGGQTVLPVIGRSTTNDRVKWLRVILPGRPNGTKGWIKQRGTVLTTTSWRLVVKTSSRRILVYRHGRLVRSFAAIVGKPSTPTPHGRFFVEESVSIHGHAGGPFALALSARSNVLQQFGGGPGQVAIHGIANLGGTLGTAISHGCVRLSNRSITWLVQRIAPGVPVAITR
jgi:lipoprotein-anchoring transpeptidase ErfK/SrfK